MIRFPQFRPHALGLLALAAALLLAAGCKPQASKSPSKATNQSRYTPGPNSNEPATLSLDGDDDAIPVTAADMAWRELQKSMEPPTPPSAWETNEPSEAEFEVFQKKYAASANAAADKAKDFYTRYPDHEKAAEARQQERRMLYLAAQMGDTNRLEQIQGLEEARLKDPNVPESERLQLRFQQLQREVMSGKDGPGTNALVKVDSIVHTLRKEFPKNPEVFNLMLTVAEAWLTENDVAKSRALAQEVATASVDTETKEGAQALLAKLDRAGKPLALKFKALDGREVDLQKLKGKVVLIDFWATWCAPCMAELPNVKAAYEKLHPRGFEIVGVSLDEDKGKLQQVLEREKMSWPQYFEEAGDNALAKEFGISSIPTMWLVDKKGVLRDLSARGRLSEKVEKLLAEN